MLKSCKYCGRIHDTKFECGRKPTKERYSNEFNSFRWSSDWKKKREHIKKRDLYLCQVCLRNLYDTTIQYNSKQLEVHHIIPLKRNYDKRLDDDNLITLCRRHHEYAEKNVIGANELKRMLENSPPTL